MATDDGVCRGRTPEGGRGTVGREETPRGRRVDARRGQPRVLRGLPRRPVVLSVRGTLPDDEDHVPAQFAEDVVIAEETSMEDAQFRNGLRAYRTKADYEHESVDVDLDAKVVRAERFVDDIEKSGRGAA